MVVVAALRMGVFVRVRTTAVKSFGCILATSRQVFDCSLVCLVVFGLKACLGKGFLYFVLIGLLFVVGNQDRFCYRVKLSTPLSYAKVFSITGSDSEQQYLGSDI